MEETPEIHPLVEKIVTIDWLKEPVRLRDAAAGGQAIRYKVLHVGGGMIQVQRDLTAGSYSGIQEPVWVPISMIDSIHSVR